MRTGPDPDNDGSPLPIGEEHNPMTDDHDREDPEVTRNVTLSVCAFILGGALAMSGGIAAAIGGSHQNVQAIAGGWGAVWSGVLLASIGGLAAHNHAAILRRNRRHHEVVMAELDGIRAMMAPASSDLDRRRSSR